MADQKNPSLPSSSAFLPSDQSLERLLGAIARGLDGLVQGSTKIAQGQDELVQGNLELRRAFADLDRHVRQSDNRTESRIADLQVAIDVFVARVESVIDAQKVVAGATVDARRALDDSRRSFDHAIEESGKHPKYDPDDENNAPKWTHKVLNFLWPFAKRRGKEAIAWGVKVTTGTVSLGAIGKLIHMAWTGHFQ